MASYEVTFTQKEIYVIVVDAESEEEAKDIADKKISCEELKYKYHNDSDTEIDAFEL